MSEPSYRIYKDDDLPVIKEYYKKLDAAFHEMGYSLPSPENVSQLWLNSFEKTLGKFSIIHVADVDGKIVGFMLSRIKQLPPFMGGMLVGELSDMWIEPEFRRFGIGRKLSVIAMDWLKKHNVHSIEIQILAGNEPSYKLYESMGFKCDYRHVRLVL
jgi:ribosomal protein S18 acetylase RimI-like enzyme